MWHSQTIVSLKATKVVLKYLCIAPFQEKSRYEVAYYLSLLAVYEFVFSSSFYLKFFYTNEALNRAENFDITYISDHLGWFLIGRIYSLGLIQSLCNRSAHRQLMHRVATLDRRLGPELKVDLSYRQLNIEFIIYSCTITIYHFGFYVIEGIFNEDNLQSMIYYFCNTVAINFFYIYALYTVYWARIFDNRSKHIMSAFRLALSQKYISKQTLTVIMELIKLLFDVRESIQNAFGSTLCIIIMVNSFQIAVSTYGLLDYFGSTEATISFWMNFLWCAVTLWLELMYIIVFYNRIGDVVSKSKHKLSRLLINVSIDFFSLNRWHICRKSYRADTSNLTRTLKPA